MNFGYDYRVNAQKEGDKTLICSLKDRNTKLAKALEELEEEENMMKELLSKSRYLLFTFCNITYIK